MAAILIPGLLCDRVCWEPVLTRMDATVADLSSQDTIEAMAVDCLALADGSLEVAGHSMGARVAMEMARIAPGRVRRLALLDTGAHPLAEGEPAKRAEIVDYANTHGMQALAERWVPPMVHGPNQTPELMRTLTDMVLRSSPERHARQINALVNRPNAEAHLHEIACPTMLIVGRQDQWSPVEQHEAMLAKIPDARLEVIEDAGHFAPLEQPDAVADVLVPFLRS